MMNIYGRLRRIYKEATPMTAKELLDEINTLGMNIAILKKKDDNFSKFRLYNKIGRLKKLCAELNDLEETEEII